MNILKNTLRQQHSYFGRLDNSHPLLVEGRTTNTNGDDDDSTADDQTDSAHGKSSGKVFFDEGKYF